jgi:hypothetical protein
MTHGGKREGAGRPKLPPAEKRHPHTVWLNEGEVEEAREAGDGDMSKGLRFGLTLIRKLKGKRGEQ